MTFDPTFKHRNLPDTLAEHIVLLLANGDLRPGQRLFEKDIGAMLGVSRMPLREALRILQAQGFVRTEPNRGTYLCQMGLEETGEMLEVRLSIERIGLRRLLKRSLVEPQVLKVLHGMIAEMRKAATLMDHLAYCRADLGFHSKIIDLSLSSPLKPMWESLSRAVVVYLMQERTAAFNYDASIADHERLVHLLEAADLGALEIEIEHHITDHHKALQAQNALQGI
ncbi:GntR family transcriptional regulator [Pseudomonas abietaniphila]